MLQRYTRPLCFLALVAGIAVFAAATGCGDSVLDPAVLERFRLYAGHSPFSAGLLLLFGLPAGMVFFLLPQSAAAAFSSSYFGLFAGTILFTCELLLAALLLFACSRVLLRPALREFLQSRAGSPLSPVPGWGLPLPFESLLLLETFLFFLAFLPAGFTGFVLGLTSMRPKAFAMAAVPMLFLRAAVECAAPAHWTGGVSALLSVIGVLLFLLFVWWLFLLFRKRVHKDVMDGTARRRVPLVRQREEAQLTEKKLRTNAIVAEMNRPDIDDSLAVQTELPVSETMVVCVRDASCSDPDVEKLIMDEAGHLGARAVSCTLAPTPEYSETPVEDGFAGHGRVRDLDEIFLRAFHEGAGIVLAVRACTPLVRESILRRALLRLTRCSAVLGPSAGGYYLIGLRRMARAGQGTLTRYEPGLLAGRGFSGELSFALAGFCRRPEKLPLLPDASDLTKPLVSVIIPSLNSADTIAGSVKSACQGPWTECFVADGGSKDDTASLASQAGAEVIAVRGGEAERLNEAARAARGQILLFLESGSLLPRGYEAEAWETLQSGDCRLGAFSLPDHVSAFRRALLWAGNSILRTSAFGRLRLRQGIFMSQEDFRSVGGFSVKVGEGRAVPELIRRMSALGRTVIHNDRISFPRSEDEEKPESIADMLDSAENHVRSYLGRKFARKTPPPDESDSDLAKRIRSMIAPCDHCGECTRVCPMLARHRIDLTGMVKAPLLAWHCFLCGTCTRKCPAGIDGVALSQALRDQYVRQHSGRMARPGHTRTLLFSKHVPITASYAREGENLLLDSDFCAVFPKTAEALAKLVFTKGTGFVVADSGARLAVLGMEEESRKSTERLLGTLKSNRVSRLVTISPSTHAYLKKHGFDVETIYEFFGRMKPEIVINGGDYALFTPCMDRSHEVFALGLARFVSPEPMRLDNIPCCGAGGEASVLEPQLAAQMKKAVRECGRPVITTCTECAAALAGAGCNVYHSLTLLMGLDEHPAIGVSSMKALVKFYIALRPLASLVKGSAEADDEIRKLQEAADGPAESEATAEDSGEKAPASSGETSPAAEAASGNAASPEAAEEAVPAGAIIPGRAEKTSEDAGEPAESALGAAEEDIPAGAIIPGMAEKPSEDDGEAAEAEPEAAEEAVPAGAVFPDGTEKASEDAGEPAESAPGAVEEDIPADAVIPDGTEKASEDAGEPAESAPGAVEEDIPAGAIIPGETEKVSEDDREPAAEHQEAGTGFSGEETKTETTGK